MKSDSFRKVRFVQLTTDARSKKLGAHLASLGGAVVDVSTMDEVMAAVGSQDAVLLMDQPSWLAMRCQHLRWLLDTRRAGKLRVVLLATDEGGLTAGNLGRGAVDEVVSVQISPKEFVMAISRAMLEPDAGTPSSRGRTTTTRARVLLIDDSELLNRLTSAILTRAGYHVTCVVNPFETYARLRKEAPDVVLVDYNMPGLRGDVLIEMIKRDGLRTPMILYSNAPEALLRDAVARSGAVGFIPKASAPEVIVERLSSLLRDHATRSARQSGA